MATAGTYTISIRATDSTSDVIKRINRTFQDQSILFKGINNSSKAINDNLKKTTGAQFSGVTRMMSKFGDTISWAANSARVLLGGLGVIGGAVSIAGIAALVDKFSQWNTTLSNNAKAIGTSTTSLQKFVNAAGMVGISPEAAIQGAKDLGKAYQDAISGRDQEANNAFTQLHLDPRNPANAIFAQPGNERALLLKLSEQFSRMPDGPSKQLIAQNAHVEGLLPLLNKGPQALQRFFDEADKYTKYTKEAEEANQKYLEATGNLNAALNSLGNLVFVSVAPALDHLKNAAADAAMAFANWLPGFLENQIKVLGLDKKDPDYSPTGLGAKEGADFRKRMGLPDASEGFWVNIKADWKLLKDELTKPLPVMNFRDDIAGALESAKSSVSDIWSSLMTTIKTQWSATWSSANESFWNMFNPLMADIEKTWGQTWKATSDKFWDIWTPLIEKFKGAWTSVGTFFDDLWDSIVGKFQAGYDKLGEVVNKLVDAHLLPESVRVNLNRDQAPGGGKETTEEEKKNLHEIYDAWRAKGYSDAQARGLTARAQLESGGNPHPPAGDGGTAGGGYQWHKDRRDKILAGTGIDVWSPNATVQQMVDALDWEMNNTEKPAGNAVRGQTTPGGAGRMVSRALIRPGLTEEAKEAEARRTAALAESYNYKTSDTPPIVSSQNPNGQVHVKIDFGNVPIGLQSSTSTIGNGLVVTQNRTAGAVLP